MKYIVYEILSYLRKCEKLKEKYGEIKESYFLTNNCKTKM